MAVIESLLATKTKSLVTYFGISVPIVAYVWLDADVLLVWVMLMILDTILGWMISFWFSQFKSREAQDRMARKGALVIMVVVLWIIGTVYNPVSYLAQTTLVAFTIAESISIVRHCYTIYAKERLPEVDVIKIIVRNIIEILTRGITKK